MKIISRYILKEHLGPFTFAVTALTSLLLLQYIARRFGDLVGKGLSWQVITEFFLLSVPFTVAMTLPMAVLVAVLYAFTRLASENEVTALKAGGVSMMALMVPAFMASLVVGLFMVAFNDQVLPRANHTLAVMTTDILTAKPTFALKEQVVNAVKEGQLYLRAGKLDPASSRMRDVTIYDLSDPTRRRTIYADSGLLEFAPNLRDLDMTLYHGVMNSVPTDQPSELTRLFYRRDRLRVPGVANGPVRLSKGDTVSKGDREMSVCEMQAELIKYDLTLQRAKKDYANAVRAFKQAQSAGGMGRGRMPFPTPRADTTAPRRPEGIGGYYCALIATLFHVREAHASGVPLAHRGGVEGEARTVQDTSLRKFTQIHPPVQGTVHLPPVGGAVATPVQVPGASGIQPLANAPSPGAGQILPPSAGGGLLFQSQVMQARAEIDEAQAKENRFAIEIHKKFSLAAACVIFVLIGAPIALRFPSGGVGLVIGVSFFIFALYYVGLIGGEELANRNIISPFWAMWGANVLLTLAGLLLVSRMGREAGTSRGENMRELLSTIPTWFRRVRRRQGTE